MPSSMPRTLCRTCVFFAKKPHLRVGRLARAKKREVGTQRRETSTRTIQRGSAPPRERAASRRSQTKVVRTSPSAPADRSTPAGLGEVVQERRSDHARTKSTYAFSIGSRVTITLEHLQYGFATSTTLDPPALESLRVVQRRGAVAPDGPASAVDRSKRPSRERRAGRPTAGRAGPPRTSSRPPVASSAARAARKASTSRGRPAPAAVFTPSPTASEKYMPSGIRRCGCSRSQWIAFEYIAGDVSALGEEQPQKSDRRRSGPHVAVRAGTFATAARSRWPGSL